jgi:tetratricopeptide (TPR) repeat protein
MTRTRFLTAAALVAVALVGVLFAGVLAPDDASEPRSASPRPALSADTSSALERLLEGLATGDTAGYVAELETAVERRPADSQSLTLLGLAYQQRQRETGDPTYLTLSEKALRRALRAGSEPLALTGLATLAVSRHRWNDAIGFARKALDRNPEDATALAALGDAYLSLGRYEQAFATYDRVAVLSPSASSYSRIAYARELLGRPQDAARAIELASDVPGSRVPENQAWVLVQLGNLRFSTGALAQAERDYRRALDRYPGYVLAEAGLARVEGARGDYESALPRLRRVVEALPLPQHAILLGDLLEASGRSSEAERTYELVGAIETLLEANGVRTEQQTALFDLDHDRDVEDALVRAREAYEAAPGVNAADVLAWALYKNGRCEEARRYSVEALRLGTLDSLMLFHRGMIERCLGNAADSSRYLELALDTNPYFSAIHAPVAKELVA